METKEFKITSAQEIYSQPRTARMNEIHELVNELVVEWYDFWQKVEETRTINQCDSPLA